MPSPSVLDIPELRRLLAVLDGDGEEARVVGGAVRNALLGLPHGDVDVATTALPAEVTRRAEAAGFRALPTGVEHGTVTVLVDHHPFEVTTLREDVETDGRRAVVAFGRDFSHDAQRRDFTINALYARPDGEVVDHVGGLADLALRRVRFIGDAETRIREDYLRILRLFRFTAEYGEGPLDPEALRASIRLRAGLARLSSERVRAELMKLLATRRAPELARILAECGFLDRILGLAPDPHAMAAAASAGADPVLRLAALAVRVREDAGLLAQRLRLSNQEAERLDACAALLEALHGRVASLSVQDWRALAYRRGAGPARDALAVLAARETGEARPDALRPAFAALAEPVPVRPWTGRAVLAHGVPAGPRVGAILARAEELWIAAGFPDDPGQRDAMLAQALAEG
ncbi:CCA tRNA nucleotidyltransferase [Alsobacter sp. KACC 23698]|uniref:CCA tRNA nucleotidyltransferase n=1 Tax=Alsobacter sp. KACC 23698 TaxID=3149229 RepID=A0AAU7JBD4_9HYPH